MKKARPEFNSFDEFERWQFANYRRNHRWTRRLVRYLKGKIRGS